MTPRISDRGGFIAGLLFFAVGSTAVAIARGYTIGSALHMGPGYFPIVLGILLVIVGAASILNALIVTTETNDRVALRPLMTISAAVLVFAAGIDHVGLIPTVFAAALLTSLAAQKPKIPEATVIAACLSALAAGIFVYGLKLPFVLF